MVRKRYVKFPLNIGVWCSGTDSYHREQKWLAKAWTLIRCIPIEADCESLSVTKRSLLAISLASYYLDFCEMAWGEGSELVYQCEKWVKKLGISSANICELSSEYPDAFEEYDLEEEPDLIAEVVLALAYAQREKVFDQLCPKLNDYPVLVAELNSIYDPTESSEVMGKVGAWFYEKCYPLYQ